jgi:hypothetical protein
MWQAVGAVLGHAVGIAISPSAIIAVILVLFSTKRVVNSLLFLAGWIVGIGVVFFVVATVADGADVSTESGASNVQAILQLVLAALFLLLAVKQWRGRPREGEPPAPPPAIFEKIAEMGPGLAIAIALAIGVVNPKNLALLVSAAAEVATYGLSTGSLVGATVVFTVIASIGVGVPVIYALVAGDSATATLTSWRTWMTANSATIMIVLFVILGAKMAGSGIATLAG